MKKLLWVLIIISLLQLYLLFDAYTRIIALQVDATTLKYYHTGKVEITDIFKTEVE